MASRAVAAASDRELEAGLPSEADDACHITGGRRPHDRGGAAVDAAVEDRPGLVVAGVGRGDHPAVELVA